MNARPRLSPELSPEAIFRRAEEALLFLCRSAVRSHHAAELATRSGFQRAFNILEGFEGELDGEGHRSSTGGWRKAGLPWIQS